MKPSFFDVFDTINVDEETRNAFSAVTIDRLVQNKERRSLKIFVDCSLPIKQDIVYSMERTIRSQMFQGGEIIIIGVPMPIPQQEELVISDDRWDFEEAYLYAKEPKEPDKGIDVVENIISTTKNSENKDKPKDKEAEKKAKKAKAKAKAKEENPDLIYGKTIKSEEPVQRIADLNPDGSEAVIRGEIFKTELKPLKNGKDLVFLYVTDDTDSIAIKLFLEPEDSEEIFNILKGRNKGNPGTFVKIKGVVSLDKFDNEPVIMSVRGIELTKDFRHKREDLAPEKRVELHSHTVMSDMDGTCDIGKLINRAKAWGHSAIAITDHGCVQGFPEAFKNAKGIKVIYGMEGYICDDEKPFCHGIPGSDSIRLDSEMVVFDLETTGLNAATESIIEIGAVKVRGSEVIDTFSAFVNPGRNLPYEIVELTSITDEMLKDAGSIEEVFPEFLEFVGDLPLVAHNADFDVSCIKATAARLGYRQEFTYIDTVPVARMLLPNLYRMKLDNVAKALMISLDHHHRAVDDAMCTALIYNKFLSMLEEKGIDTIGSLNGALPHDPEYIGKLFTYHGTILVKNDIGRINLYRMVSDSHLKYFHTVPRIPKSLLSKRREGLLLGSGCARGELFDAIKSGKNEDELRRIVEYYDFLEVQPPENNTLLTEERKYGIQSLTDIKRINAKIVSLGEKYGKPVVATGDCHFIDPEDEIYRRIILSEKKRSETKVEEKLFFRTTEEMIEAFNYLGDDKAYELVVTNSNLISDMIENIRPTRPDTCPPVIENSDVILREICYRKATSMYGDPLPEVVKNRLERELNSIIDNGYALMYIIAQKLVWKSNEDGYIVGSRGSVGSSLVATMAGISEVNPLPTHYYCTDCHYVDFDSEDIKKHAGVAGCDLPDKTCPHCGKPLLKDGFDIPFETFLGFNGDKEPDIDLNFSGAYLNKAHKYTEVIFGDGQTYRAGTFGTIKDNTAYAYAKSYFAKKDIHKKRCELERISLGCLGVRKSTGQHPGGIIVLPVGEEMESFTPVQHPANDMETDIVTTHFDFHSIDQNLLKLDILGKDDPTQIKILEEITGLGVNDIPLDDRKVLSLFQETSALGLEPEDIMGCDFGTLGIPEFGTDFAMGILRDTKPQSIMDLVRIAGLSHGTDVYNGNAKELILDGHATLQTAICTRDDIMLYLIDMGVEKKDCFKIMESVRKGKGLTPEWEEQMKAAGVPEWYIWSCKTIKYMFPKAHAAAYVMMAYRLGYFKVYEPLAFYAAYFSIKATAFDYAKMCQGPEVLMHYIEEYKKIDKPTAKEKDALRDMRIVQEMLARGFSFLPVDIYKSDAVDFKVEDGKLRPPFNAIEGMGEKAAESLHLAAKTAPFTSLDDIRDRGKLTQSLVDSMVEMGILKGFSQSNQLSLFDLMKG